MASHLIGNWSKGGRRALCGQPFNENHSIARNGEPTCPNCQNLDELEGKSLLALQQDTPPPAPKVEHFSSTDGYRPKGSRR